MTQLSKRQLAKELERQIFDSFWSVIADLRKKSEVSLFFTDFFTRVEKVNFAKRVSIAFLISKGYDYKSIRDLLKVSTNTIGRVVARIEDDGWQLFLKKLETKEEWEKFWHDTELLLWRFTGRGSRLFKSTEELEGLIRSRRKR